MSQEPNHVGDNPGDAAGASSASKLPNVTPSAPVEAEAKEALVSHALPWLDRRSDPQQLAAQLESEKYFTKEDDAENTEVMRALGASGVERTG